MASSTYIAYSIGINEREVEGFLQKFPQLEQLDSDFIKYCCDNCTNSDYPNSLISTEEIIIKTKHKNKSFGSFSSSTHSTHSCRETLLSELSRHEKFIGNYYTKRVSIIRYSKELSKKIDDITLEKVNKFSELYSLPLNIYIIENEIYLLFPSNNFNLNLSSLLLWCFRNVQILDYILEQTSEQRLGMSFLGKILSNAFLEFPEFGNVYNSNFLLSVFSWRLFNTGSQHDDSTYSIGPVRGAEKYGFSTIFKYLKEFYFPLYGDNRSKIELNSDYVDSSLIRTCYEFLDMLSSLKGK